jgi:hypothetical protein
VLTKALVVGLGRRAADERVTVLGPHGRLRLIGVLPARDGLARGLKSLSSSPFSQASGVVEAHAFTHCSEVDRALVHQKHHSSC